MAEQGGPRHWETWFLALAVPFGLLLLVLQPMSATPDAMHHTLRIDQLARGQLVAPRGLRNEARAVPGPCLYGYLQSVSSASVTTWHFGDWFRTGGCKDPLSFSISNTAVNSPVTYLPALAGYEVGRVTGNVVVAVLLLRLATLAAYIAGCWFAIRVSPRGKPVLFLVALLPTSLSLAAGISGDPVPNALAFVAVALTLRLSEPDIEPGAARRWLIGLGCVLPLLCLAKNIYAPFVLLAVLVPRPAFRSAAQRGRFVAGTVVASLVPAILWSSLVVSRISQISWWPTSRAPVTLSRPLDLRSLRPLTSNHQLLWIEHHPLGFLHIVGRSLVHFTTWNKAAYGLVGGVFYRLRYTTMPDALMVLLLAAAGIAVVADVHVSRKFDHSRRGLWTVLASLGIAAVTTFLVFLGEALAITPPLEWSPLITWIEGRFFIPLLSLVVLPIAAVTTSGPTRRTSWVVPLVSTACLIWLVATTLVMVY